MYGVISPALFSKLTDAALEEVSAWQTRPHPIAWFDALNVIVRQEQRVIKKAIYIALAVNLSGQKEILGMWISPNEGAKFWLSIFTELKNRGLKDIFIACVDGLAGLDEALETAFSDVMVQTCLVHMVRSSTKYVSYKDRKKLCADLKAIYQATTEKEDLSKLDKFAKAWDGKYPMISKSWRNHRDRIAAMFLFPEDIRRTIYTTNAVESMNMTLRKASKKRRIFPAMTQYSKSCIWLPATSPRSRLCPSATGEQASHGSLLSSKKRFRLANGFDTNQLTDPFFNPMVLAPLEFCD